MYIFFSIVSYCKVYLQFLFWMKVGFFHKSTNYLYDQKHKWYSNNWINLSCCVNTILVIFFVFLVFFVCGFSSHLENFLLIYTCHYYWWRAWKILTYARHSWPFSSDGSVACHTYCDPSQPFIMVIFEDPWHAHLLPRVRHLSFHYLFFTI